MLQHPLFSPSLRQLVDMSRSDSVNMTSEQIESLPYIFDQQAKRAMFATSALTFSLPRLAQIRRTDRHRGTMLVCHTLKEALKWIELDLEDYYDLCKEVGFSII